MVDGWDIWQGDCREVLSLVMPDNSVDSCVTDPPYELGFMGKAWDRTGVAFDPATWAEVLRVLKPGAYVLAFGGTRTYHRMACAIEDAGFEVRDQIGWVYGSGFPKSHNGEWGGTALKPAWEPICVARKPLVGTVEANWREWGTGALNIDECRVGFADEEDRAAAFPGGRLTSHGVGSLAGPGAAQNASRSGFATQRNDLGRWPANLIHDDSDEVLAAFPEAPGQMADASSSDSRKTQNAYGAMKRGSGGAAARQDADKTAARFFYCAKASKKDRNDGVEANIHPTVKPTELMRYLCRLVTPRGGLVLDPFAGSGSTGRGARLEGFRFLGCELNPEYVALARARIGAVETLW